MQRSPCSSCVHFPWTSLPQPDTTVECAPESQRKSWYRLCTAWLLLCSQKSPSALLEEAQQSTKGKLLKKSWNGLGWSTQTPSPSTPCCKQGHFHYKVAPSPGQPGLEQFQGWGISQNAVMEQSHSLSSSSSSSIPPGAACSQHSQSVLKTSHCRIYTNLNTHGVRKRKNPCSCALDRRLLDGSRNQKSRSPYPSSEIPLSCLILWAKFKTKTLRTGSVWQSLEGSVLSQKLFLALHN